jgi:hypothetical protein
MTAVGVRPMVHRSRIEGQRLYDPASERDARVVKAGERTLGVVRLANGEGPDNDRPMTPLDWMASASGCA